MIYASKPEKQQRMDLRILVERGKRGKRGKRGSTSLFLKSEWSIGRVRNYQTLMLEHYCFPAMKRS